MRLARGGVLRPDASMTATRFKDALDAALAPYAQKADHWDRPAYRTHLMLGHAIRGSEPGEEECVLRETMKRLGYRWHMKDPVGEGCDRTWTRKRWGLDLGAVISEEVWHDAYWSGAWRTTRALEVEKDICEFALTMRGLLDVRADLYVGLFHADDECVDVGDIRAGSGPTTWSAHVGL